MKNIRVSQGDWAKLGIPARLVRDAVFIQEQGIPEDLEHDEHDVLSRHVVLFVDETPVATGRLDPQGKIGRVSVMPALRKKGFGKRIMDHLEAMAKDGCMNKVIVHAQSRVVPFYEVLGYSAFGPEFFEAGIAHQGMSKDLK